MSKIALVDDDRNILTSVSMTLEAEGFEVETYNDGQAALDAFNKNCRTWQSWTSRCLAWMEWIYFSAFVKNENASNFPYF